MVVSWMGWTRCPGWPGTRCCSSLEEQCQATARHCSSPPGHGYLFLENLEYVARVARHQVLGQQVLEHGMLGLGAVYCIPRYRDIPLAKIDLIKSNKSLVTLPICDIRNIYS